MISMNFLIDANLHFRQQKTSWIKWKTRRIGWLTISVFAYCLKSKGSEKRKQHIYNSTCINADCYSYALHCNRSWDTLFDLSYFSFQVYLKIMTHSLSATYHMLESAVFGESVDLVANTCGFHRLRVIDESFC